MWEPLDPEIGDRIEHVVVVMMENRSFDHMLGYLALPEWKLEGGEIDGIPEGGFAEEWEGQRYESWPLGTSSWPKGAEDPPHGGEPVAWQVADTARYLATYKKRWPKSDPGVVMSYLTPAEVPLYDHLARNYCVCDRWFCSVAGATWPNRLFAVAGDAGGETDIPETALEGILGDRLTMFHLLDEHEVSWRWYSSDPSLLRAFSPRYRFNNDLDRFAYFRHRTRRQQRNFLADAAAGDLPEFSWVDPNFFRLPLGIDGPLEPDDDHPPHDVMKGQRFVNTVYSALRRNEKAWEKTLLLITYDEHGGFYDHVLPPAPRGPRVPAFAVSPWLEPGRPCHTQLEHTSIIKTALRRFLGKGAEEAAERLGPRVYYANDLWDMIAAERTDAPEPGDLGEATVTDDDLVPEDLKGGSTLDRVLQVIDEFGDEFVELQKDLVGLFKRLRGIPDGQP
jgi:phospholipase C